MDVAVSILSQLTSPLVEELGTIWNFKDDLENLKNTVSSIKAVLGDAEGKTNNLQVSDWLKKVKDLFLDADDLLDDFSSEALRRQVITKNKRQRKVRVFFSTANQIAYRYKMGRQLKEIMNRFDDISEVKNQLQLIESPPKVPALHRERRHTFSEPEDKIFGREEEKKLIVRQLTDTNNMNNISVISIVGFGGLGKTALAQLVYNDEAVNKYFDLKMWTCVSDEFALGVQQIAQKILGKEMNAEMEQVKEELRKKIEGKKFLLVLDDVWSEDRDIWLKVKKLLMGGRRGSMILVTTRSKHVGRMMDAYLSFSLEGLDDTKSWELFCRMAFEKDEEPKEELVQIGKDIVKKCVGVPLAIRTVGSLLYSRNLGEGDWRYFRDTELPKIDGAEGNKIFDILKLSYDHLPSNLKNCFAYCSLFPKDFQMEREKLIQLWVAQGFIQSSSDQSRSEDDIGHEYFMMLLSRCFFQDVQTNEFGDIKRCKMHDLMHDLARSVTKDECTILSEGKEHNFGDGMRHLSSECESSWKFPTSKAKIKRLRTILSPVVGFRGVFPTDHHLPQFMSRLHESVGCNANSLPKCLRVLDLSGAGLEHVPDCIGQLKNLRYLDLSRNNFSVLPQGIIKLQKLQTLKLYYCKELRELPINFHYLASLKHLELEGCRRLMLMPRGLGQLTYLRTLSEFRVHMGSDSASIMELCGLNSLGGKLKVQHLDVQRSNVEEIESAKLLLGKSNLRELGLYWDFKRWLEMEENEREESKYKDEKILEALQPYHTLESLTIRCFSGYRLPEWIGNLTSLIKLEIVHCCALESLPRSIGNLTSLRELILVDCSRLASLPESLGNLTSLHQLKICSCNHIKLLPKGVRDLIFVQKLHVNTDGQLKERYQRAIMG